MKPRGCSDFAGGVPRRVPSAAQNGAVAIRVKAATLDADAYIAELEAEFERWLLEPFAARLEGEYILRVGGCSAGWSRLRSITSEG
jgi:hypothetical protein